MESVDTHPHTQTHIAAPLPIFTSTCVEVCTYLSPSLNPDLRLVRITGKGRVLQIVHIFRGQCSGEPFAINKKEKVKISRRLWINKSKFIGHGIMRM
jgi:hypothetical protein